MEITKRVSEPLEFFELNDLVLELRELCKAAKVALIERANGHFHLIGKRLINYYPFSPDKTIYIEGENSYRGLDMEEAVKMANTSEHDKIKP